MPVYEYECNSCHFRFDKRQGFDDAPVAECPKCHGTSRRVFYPAPIIFRGSGFYMTDSRGDTGGDSGGAGDSEADAGKEKSPSGESAKETEE